jgi:shikimate kinase
MSSYSSNSFYIPKTIALVGMMGAGKSTIGSRLAKKLGKPFCDSDQAVEKAAGGYPVSDIYEQWGEKAFKEAEYNVIQRLLSTEPVHVLSTGEGAFISEKTRELLQDRTITVWLKSDVSTLANRVQRKVRPQLIEGNTEEVLTSLVKERYPFYSMADICVESDDEFYQEAVDRIILALKEHLYPTATGPWTAG